LAFVCSLGEPAAAVVGFEKVKVDTLSAESNYHTHPSYHLCLFYILTGPFMMMGQVPLFLILFVIGASFGRTAAQNEATRRKLQPSTEEIFDRFGAR
jgi:hypothetical protein